MKNFIIIISILLFIFACEDENPVAPKKTTNADSLYISKIIPEYGIPSQEIQILGKGFGNDKSSIKVFFGDTIINTTFISDTLIKLITPDLPLGKYMISVKVLDSIAYSPVEFEIINNDMQPDSLIITNISPRFGVPGSEIYIIGRDFGNNSNNTIVYFGGTNIKATLISDTLIKILTPDLPLGKYKISIKVLDSVAYSPVDFEIIKFNYKFSKIEVWFNNFICQVQINSYSTSTSFPEGTTSWKTFDTVLYESAYFLLNKKNQPSGTLII